MFCFVCLVLVRKPPLNLFQLHTLFKYHPIFSVFLYSHFPWKSWLYFCTDILSPPIHSENHFSQALSPTTLPKLSCQGHLGYLLAKSNGQFSALIFSLNSLVTIDYFLLLETVFSLGLLDTSFSWISSQLTVSSFLIFSYSSLLWNIRTAPGSVLEPPAFSLSKLLPLAISSSPLTWNAISMLMTSKFYVQTPTWP